MRFLAALFLAVMPGFPASFPLFFFPKPGASPVQYVVRTPDLSARFSRDAAIFQVHRQQIRVRFAGANPAVSLSGLEPLAARINFFLGSAGWRTDVPSYSKIVYHDLYPGIDMTYGGTGAQLKSEFLVAPGANPGLIRLEYSEPLSIDAAGNLAAGGEGAVFRAVFQEAAPEIYQLIAGGRVKIAGRYRLLDRHTAGFELGPYDTTTPLVIDPTVTYCSYLGGSSITNITGVAVDSSANLYVTGWTEALDFPIAGAVQAANQGGVDAIVAKLNATGTALVYATYIGGSADDRGAAIAVDNLGQAYVTGQTSSHNFPQVAWNGSTLTSGTMAFVLKLNAAGNALLYCGYLGGSPYDIGTAIAVDATYSAYIAGDTQSANFPLINPTQSSIGGGIDAFIIKLKPSGAIAFSTFLGGSGNEHAGGIAVDSQGDIFVAGGTYSNNFPVVAALQPASAGQENAFVTKISSSGSIAFSTYLGGTGGLPQQANAIALDPAGNPYIAGATTSANFPVISGAFQTTLAGQQSAFIAKFTADGSALAYSTYLGGVASDWATGIAVSAAGNAYVTGYTSSVTFPQVSAVLPFGGLTDAFISVLNSGGNGLIFSTFYGGSGQDAGSAIALDANADIFIGGQTSSQDLPLVAPLESGTAASNTGWILAFTCSGLALTPDSRLFPIGGGTGNVTVADSAGCPWNATTDSSSWISLTGASGAGAGAFSYTVAPNAGLARLGTIAVGTQSFKVMQGGAIQTFNDVPASDPNFDYISLMHSFGITSGCLTTPPLYCPSTPVTRAQMAVFIVVGLDIALKTGLTYNPSPYFQDMPSSSPYFPFVQDIRDLGITAGCQVGPPLFCPDTSITQGQMAVFMITGWMVANRLSTFTYTTTPYFTDVVPADPFFKFVQKMRDLGFNNGCTPTTYCETSAVTRDAMAPMIMRSLLGAP